jgi:hypothetical protein
MRKSGGFFAVILLIPFCGCRHGAEPVIPENGARTLKSLIAEKESAIEWTVDVGRQDAPARRGRVPITPDNMFAARTEIRNADIVYPELAGFGPVDTSLLGNAERGKLGAFCSAIIARDRTRAENLMNPDNRFLLVVFFTDIRDAEFTERYVMGRPGMRGDLWQVPVRFFLKSGYIDIQIFFLQGESITIDQISYGEIQND